MRLFCYTYSLTFPLSTLVLIPENSFFWRSFCDNQLSFEHLKKLLRSSQASSQDFWLSFHPSVFPVSLCSLVPASVWLVLCSGSAFSVTQPLGEKSIMLRNPLRLPHQWGKLMAGLTHFPIIVCRCFSEQTIPKTLHKQENTPLAKWSCWELEKENPDKRRKGNIHWQEFPGHRPYSCSEG